MAVLINGNGNEAIYAQQDADWYAALMGGVTMITAVGEQFAYELLDANTIGVKDGVIITKEGRRIQVDTNVIDTFDIPTGAQGTTNYYIIGYHLVTDEESVQSAETFVQLMDNGTDTIPEGSFKEGDDDVYVSLYRVEQNDLTIGTITLLLPTVSDSMQQQISQINNDLSVQTIPFTPSVGQNETGDGWNGCYFEVIGKLVICHVAIKSAPQVTLTTTLATIPSNLVPQYRTMGVCGTGANGTDINILSQRATNVSQLCVFQTTSGYITGTLMWIRN